MPPEGIFANAIPIVVGEAPEAVLIAHGFAWVANHRAGSVSRIDPATNEVLTIAFRPGDVVGNVIVAGPSSIWVDLYSALGRIDVDTNEATVIATRGGNRESGGHAYADGTLWLYAPPTLIRYDPATDWEMKSFPIGTADPESRMVSGAGSLWIAAHFTGLYRVDPENGDVIAHIDDVHPFKVFSDGESVWIADEDAGTVARIDTDTNTVGEPIVVRPTPGGILGRVVGEQLWVMLSDGQGIAVVDGDSGTVVKSWVSNDTYAGYLDVGFGSAWIPTFHTNTVWRAPVDELGLDQ